MIIKYNDSSYFNLNCIKNIQIVCSEMSNDPKNPELLYKIYIAVDEERYRTPLKNLTEDECKEVISIFESALGTNLDYFNFCQEFSSKKEKKDKI